MVFVGFILLLSGCQHGCNFNWDTVLESKSEHRTIDGMPLDIIMENVEQTAYNFTWRILRGGSPHLSKYDPTHWLTFRLSVGDRPELKENHFAPSSPDANLEQALKAFEVHFSPDKQHFYTIFNREYFKTYHLLSSGAPFCSPWMYRSTTPPQWKDVPSPDAIVRDMIAKEDTLNAYVDCREQLKTTLKQFTYVTPYDYLLTEKFPYSNFASDVLDKDRVTHLAVKSSDWKSKMIKRSLEAIAKKEEISRSSYMLLYIADPAAIAQADAQLFPLWVKDMSANSYVKERLGSYNKPAPNAQLIRQLNADANRELLNPTSEFRDQGDEAFDILFLLKDHSQFKAAINRYVSPSHYMDNQTYTDVMFNLRYDKFTAAEQQLILNGYKNLLPQAKDDFTRSFIFSFLKQHLPCQEVKKLQDQYAALKDETVNC